MRNLPATSLIAALFSALTVNAQSPASTDKTLRFEVSSVKLAAPDANASGIVLAHRALITTDPGRIHYVNAGLKDLIMNVYNLKDYQVLAPDSLNSIAVDIDATMRPGSTKEQVRVMFQTCSPTGSI